jgi:alkylation response protein AidB-like acyl-CoA dehydrogenase
MYEFQFDPCELPPEALRLRAEVREFLDKTLRDYPASKRALTWQGFDSDFTLKLAEQGWIGMTWPKEYGGHERSALERYVVLEELLASGAPVAAHWIADRQSGPLLLRYGTEEQRREFVPAIARGEAHYCIGMSEPDSGSDLASMRTRGERVDGGWVVNGSKLWTTHAHRCNQMIALIRTNPDPDSRHAGLSQFLIDMDMDGLEARPIRDLSGHEHFNEVVFKDVFVPVDRVIGEEGQGWQQVIAELALERSGPERYLSSFLLLKELIRELGGDDTGAGRRLVGRCMAHLATLRQMSLSVAGMLNEGKAPALEASVVKDVGTGFEQDLPEWIHALLGLEPDLEGDGDLVQVLAYLTQVAPSFSLRGGTREILRGIIARGLGLR